MTSLHEKKPKKFVPRFRRKNANLVDIDDEEAQELINKDLESNFIWTTTLNDQLEEEFHNYQFENNQNEQKQQLSFHDDLQKDLIYDFENNNQFEHLWKSSIHDNENLIQWKDLNQQNKIISFSLDNQQQQKQQQWTIIDKNNQEFIKFNLNDQNQQINQYDLDFNYQNKFIHFIKDEHFNYQMKFGIESNEEENIFPKETEDLKKLKIDLNIPSINLNLSIPQNPIIFNWIKGISQYKLSLNQEEYIQKYSPLNEFNFKIDMENLNNLKWSIDYLKDNNLISSSYLINLSLNDDNNKQIYSFNDDKFNFNLSINNEYKKQLYSIIDFKFKQNLNIITTNDIKEQILSISDLINFKQNFGSDEEQFKYCKDSLKQFKYIILNLSLNEFINFIYSPNDVKTIDFQNLFIQSDDISARAFRRYRCKHMSIKFDQNYQLDSQINSNLLFKGNESIAIGEQFIQNDFNQQQLFKDIVESNILINDNIIQCYDILTSNSSPINLGPCLYRYDYERDLSQDLLNNRREIGYISFDGSLEKPIYYLNKSYKRYLHIPKPENLCSYNVYQGYKEFIENTKINPNYFRSFDATDLRHLLYWYKNKQYLFSKDDSNLLKPPTFICRRKVLRTILANLYCDSEPWKLFVIRIKGQFYLSLANKSTKKPEDMTEDEYSGYKFEQLFTTNQPNTTRFNQNINLDKPQQGFHTVQYWQFGEFNILYTNEIDAEYIKDKQQKTTDTIQINKQTTDQTTTTTENTESKPVEVNWWDGGTKIEMENPTEEVKVDENKKESRYEIKDGYVEMKCTNKKIFYRDENKLQTLYWWAQMWLANINTLMIGYKKTNNGSIDHLDLLSINELIIKFLSKYNLRFKYCFSYLYSFLKLIKKTINIDDLNTIHVFTYIPQPLQIDKLTGKTIDIDLPEYVPFRYTIINRSHQRHSNFIPQWYLNYIQRTILNDKQSKTIQQEIKKRISHRGRNNCILKKNKTIKKN